MGNACIRRVIPRGTRMGAAVSRSCVLALVLALGAVCVPLRAEAQTNQLGMQQNDLFGGMLIGLLDNSFGIYRGVESRDPITGKKIKQRNDFAMTRLTLIPRVDLWYGIQAGVRFDLMHEWTNSDLGVLRNETDISNMFLEVRHLKAWQDPWLGIRVTARGGAWLPTSRDARENNKFYANLMAAGGLMWIGHGFMLRYELRLLKFFFEYDQVGVQTRNYGGDIRPNLNQQGLSTGLMNPNWGIQNFLTGSYNITNQIAVAATVLFRYTETHATPNDGFGAPGDVGRVAQRDSVLFALELSYMPLSYLGFALGLAADSPRLGPDATTPYTPFEDNYNNFTNLYFTIFTPMTW